MTRVNCTPEFPALYFEPINNNRLKEYFSRPYDGYYRLWTRFYMPKFLVNYGVSRTIQDA